MSYRENFHSFIPVKTSMPEFTIKAVLVGALLAIILGSANAYFGLYAGMTVSAAIPGAVMAFALLRPLKGTLLEVNIGMMGAAAGASLAAGVIFTIPAMLLLGAWTEIHYVETTIIAALGGILGVLWMVPLRRALIIKTDLPFPEGVAVAAVLTTTVGDGRATKTTEEAGLSGIWLLIGAVLGAALKFAQVGLHAIQGKLHGIINIGRFNIGSGEHDGLFYGGIATSPALLGVGWIIGPRIASFVFIGGLIGWVVIAPLIVLAIGIPVPTTEAQIASAMSLAGGNLDVGKYLWGFYEIWGDYIRYIGVGAMVVGGLFTIFKLRTNISDGIKEAVTGLRSGQTVTKKRTDQDLNFKYVFLGIGALTIPVFLVYAWISSNYLVSGVMAVFAILFAFIASAIAGYMAGLVGSSNNPTSGVTVSVLLLTCLILLGFGLSGSVGAYGIALLIAAVIACCAAISGDVLQSMTAGQIIGATPYRQQLAELVGIVAAAPVLALVVSALHQAYTIGSTNLPAPQAFLMSGVVQGVLGGEMVWPFVLAGMVLAFILILIDVPVLPVAIGIYLPFTLATPIFCGGIIRYLTNRKITKCYGSDDDDQINEWELAIKRTKMKPKERIVRTGLLFTAGLIAGEALTGVVVAFIIISGLNIVMFEFPPVIPGLLLWLFIAGLVFYIPLRELYNSKR
ncbi:MAG: oligopeptide transporter, OPT family [Candidatus Thermoplasmatota archaeon]|nr:oligopeptide transporter, OPT family [Candidatus Thermoplasmatota archaeon]